MQKQSTKKTAAVLAGFMLLAVSYALAATLFFQGFETDTSGWFDDSNGGIRKDHPRTIWLHQRRRICQRHCLRGWLFPCPPEFHGLLQ